ncbi:MAG TPA: amidohydrolase family protein [Vicinamibacteria bacterium]|nr:amidohydrolase family protein [Vicinamibacteria bacterium]
MLSRRRFIELSAASAGALALRGLASAQEERTPVIDMHVHFLRKVASPPLYAPGLKDNPLVSHWTWHEHNGDLLVQEMNVAGVDKALLKTFNAEDIAYPLKMEFGAEPWQFESSEGYMLEYRDKYPDRFFWAATVNPTLEDFQERWMGKFARNLQGIVLFPGLQDHALDHPNITWLLDECEKRSLRAVQMSFENVNRSHTSADYIRQLHDMIDAHPTLHFSFLHTGYQVPHMLEREPTLQLINHFNEKNGNVWAQTGNYYLDTRYPFPNQLEGTKDLFDNIGSERVIWATDWPWIENIGKYYQFVQSVRENCTYMTKEQMAKYLGGNALDFLALSTS